MSTTTTTTPGKRLPAATRAAGCDGAGRATVAMARMPQWHQAMLASLLMGGAVLIMVHMHGLCSRQYVATIFVALWLLHMVAWGIWSSFIYPHYVSPLRHLPQPEGAHWLFGHGLLPVDMPSGTRMRKWVTSTQHGHVIRLLTIFNRERLIVTSPRALTEILIYKSYMFEKPRLLRSVLGLCFGNGLIVSEGHDHKAQRRVFMPAFRFRCVKDLYPTFWDKATESVHAMTSACDDGCAPLTIYSWAARCTLDIVGLTSMGVDVGAMRDEKAPLYQACSKLRNTSVHEKVQAFLSTMVPAWLLRCILRKRTSKLVDAGEQIRALCSDIIRSKEQKLAKVSYEREDKADILSLALQSGIFSHEQLAEQLMTFLVVGHDTTSVVLTCAANVLSRFPEKQSRLRDEVRAMLRARDAAANMSSADIDGLPYLNAVCNEVLRLYTPVEVSLREALCDTTIGDSVVRKGAVVMMALGGTNVSPALWGPDADRFRPERWLRAEGGGPAAIPSNYAFLSFLHGPRGCIGAGYARAVFACLLAAWVDRFEFRLQHQTPAKDTEDTVLDLNMPLLVKLAV